MRSTDREGSDALLVGAQGLGDGAHGSAVVSICHQTQALLCLGKLSQAVQPEVEVLRCHPGSQTLVQFTGELMTTLQSWHKTLHTPIIPEQILIICIIFPPINFKEIKFCFSQTVYCLMVITSAEQQQQQIRGWV